MRKSNINYNNVICKLDALYQCTIFDCYYHPERLKDILKQVYKEDYNSILNEIDSELERLADVEQEKDEFLKFMRS